MDSEKEELLRILKDKIITPVFQPIVNLKNGEIFGYEALSRGPKDGFLERPDKLFGAAEKYQYLWKLDYLCRSMAIMKAKDNLKEKMLFLNVDARILYDKKFHQGSTQALLKKYNIENKNIVFEISEKSAIDDYAGFQAVLENYRSQGYKIAIDDVGAGYSGLNLLAKVSPNFIKLDIGLIHDIHKDKMKKAIVKAMVDFSHATNIRIIAEGIEEKADLDILISYGIEYGQGFYLGKPLIKLTEIKENIKKEICVSFEKKEAKHRLTTCIGEISENELTFSSDTLCYKVLEYLRTFEEYTDIIVVDYDKPVGLLSRDIFYSKLATTYGVSVYNKRSISLLMDHEPLILDYFMSIEEASKRALARNSRHIYDSLIITKNNQYYGTVTIKKLLESVTQLEIKQAKQANPLTGLPGNMMIECEMNRYIHYMIPFIAIYIDLDNFKIYNDIYGFEAGDRVLVATADILRNSLEYNIDEYFLGHIGGDDFIIFIKAKNIDLICENMIQKFDEKIKSFYSIEHQQNEYVIGKGRDGKVGKFPLIAISLAVLKVDTICSLDSNQLAKKSAKIKKLCKENTKSNFIVKRYEEV